MQVTKSSQHCSLLFGQEAQSNASSSMTSNSPQMSQIPRQPGQGNRSWLSTYNITIPEETKPVLSVDNPGGSNVEEVRPASISDESICSGSSVAETSIVQKGKRSEEAQETAVAILEETRLVLSIASQSDFKIEKTRPVPIPDEFLYFDRNLDDISTLYKGDNFVEAKKKAIVMVKILEGKPEAENLIRYLNSVIFLCHVMQDMTFCHDLPANNSAGFINWMLTIAEAAGQESDDLPASSKLMLFCLRWAADAGDQGARQYLVKILLFRQLCPDMPSPDVHFFPAEALEHLVNMARDDTQLPKPGNDQDGVISRMVELIKLRNTENLDSKKKELVDFLRHHSQPEIQLLIPLIYTSEVFGPAEYDKAREYLERFPAPDVGEAVNSPVADVCQFWKLMCTVVPQESHEAGTIEELNQLAQKGFLAAIHLLSELSREREDILLTHVVSFILSPKPCFSEYPHLIHSLCKFYSEKIKKQNGLNEPGIQGHAEEMLNNIKGFLRNARIQGDSRMRDHIIWPGFRKIFNTENLRKTGRESVPPLPEATIKILQNSQYTQDPAALIYIHCAQVLRHGNADEKLIEAAERKDALSTYFHMLMMSDATEEMDNVVLANKLLDVLHVKAQDFRVWRDHPGFEDFINKLHLCALRRREPESCNLLCLDLLKLMGNLKKDSSGIPKILNSIGLGKMLQGKIEEANQYYKQAWDQMDPSNRGDRWRVNETTYQVVRPDLPEYYYQLSSIQVESSHPMETRCRFNQLLSVWKKMQESKDPSLWDAWITMTCDFITFSRWHITPKMCQTLIDNIIVAIAKQHSLSSNLLLTAGSQLLSIMNNVANRRKVEGMPDFSELTTGARELDQAINNQASTHLEIGSTDEVARLPNLNIANSYVVQHHVLANVQEAKSIDDVIKYMKKLTLESDVDSATFIRLLVPWFDSELLPPKCIDDVSNILLLLQKKLGEQANVILELKIDSECRLMVAMHMYCDDFIGEICKTMENIIERMDDKKTTLIIKNSKRVMMNIDRLGGEFSDKKEYGVFCWAALEDKTLVEFNELLINAIELYHPRVALKLFHKLFKTKEECILKLEQLRDEYDNYSHVLRFVICQLKGQKDEILPLLKDGMRKKTLSDDQKIRLLWYAYESPSIIDKMALKQVATLINNLPNYFFIKILVKDVRSHKQFLKVATLDNISTLKESQLSEIALKVLPLDSNCAASMWRVFDSEYPLAMLKWHHDILALGFDVGQALQTAAENGEVKAQCELIHWLLEQERDGEKIAHELKRKACRFVHLPHPMAGAESVLYQGITQYLGFSGEPDLMTGKQKIQEALDMDPLIVALRLYDLKEQGLFALPGDTTDYLWCYAQALSERDKDPYNRRDNYFNNLFLSYGSEALQKLLVSLRNRAESGPSGKAVYQKAASRLGGWFAQTTVFSASASRGISRVTASSTKTSPKKPKGAESLARASRKTSKVTVSSTKESQKTLKESVCTEDDVDQVIDCATTGNWNSGALGKINQLTNRLRREKADLETVTKGGVEEKLHLLLTVMPVGTQELAKCADAVVDLISSPEKVTELILFWITQSKFAQNRDEKAFWLERILKCFPKDHSINLNDHKEEVLCFLELLIQHQLIPKEAEYLLDGLSADERAQLLLKGLPEGINANPKMYQQYVETVQSPDSTLIDNIWRALKSESDAALVRATFTALIRQRSSELCAIKADDGRLNGIDLYRLFSDSSTSDRETLLEDTFFALRELLVKSYLQFRKENPGKLPPPKHLESTIRKFVDGKQRSMKDSLDILIMTREHKVNAALLQDYHCRIKQMASEYLMCENTDCEQRLTANAILCLIL